MTNFLGYGQVDSPRQGEIIRGLASPQVAMQPDISELAKALVREMRESEHPNERVNNEPGFEIGVRLH